MRANRKQRLKRDHVVYYRCCNSSSTGTWQWCKCFSNVGHWPLCTVVVKSMCFRDWPAGRCSLMKTATIIHILWSMYWAVLDVVSVMTILVEAVRTELFTARVRYSAELTDSTWCSLDLGLGLLDLCLFAPSRSQSTNHLSPSGSVLFCRLHLPPAVSETRLPHFCQILFFQIFLGRPLPLWPCSTRCSAFLAMLSSFLLKSKPVPFSWLPQRWLFPTLLPLLCWLLFQNEFHSRKFVVQQKRITMGQNNAANALQNPGQAKAATDNIHP